MWKLLWFVVGVSCEVLVIDNGVSVSTGIISNITGEYVDKNYSRAIPTISTRATEDLNHVIKTEHGDVHGYEEDGIVQYFDIPYGAFSAERPFQKPSKPESWETILENTEHISKCPQINSTNDYVGNHECLTLSVFKPQNADNADVLFHIHDSYFHTGSGDPLIYGPRQLVPHGIILVLPNYRLGPLGFLCLRNESVPGNAGLKDLALALEWTVNNIESFGGNASNVVVSGSGAAGALVEYLLLSNCSRTFISKSITESGFILCPWALDRNPLDTAKSLLDKLAESENSHNSEQINNVFEQINLETLVRGANGINFGPCIESEGGFISETPWSLLQNHKSEISCMLGSTNQAAMEEALQHNTDESLSKFNLDPSLLLPSDLKFESDEQKLNIALQVKVQYFGENNITLNDLKNFSQCLSDSKYLYSGVRGARLLGKGGATIYFYELSYGDSRPLSGAARGDFVSFVFSKGESSIVRTTDEDYNVMQNKIIDLWVKFIKTGEPSTENIRWNNLKDVTETEEEWLSIGEELLMQKGFHINRLKLWNDIYEEHFIEHNLGLDIRPSIYMTLFLLILLLYLNRNDKQ